MNVNAITSTGMTVKSRADILNDLITAFNGIYGTSLSSADSSNPDVQWLNAIAQAAVDNLDLQVQIYNGFDPDLAIGFVLDQRVAINGIQRLGGTYTITNITLTITNAISQSLIGLNADPNNCFTVADNLGNQWQLIDTQSPVVAGTYTYPFRAALPGAVLAPVNTIQTLVSVILGVTACNNASSVTSTGTTQETDAQLRVRRQKSVTLSSVGFLSGLIAALQNLAGVTSATILENTTGLVDSNGVPGHSIWAIIAGSPVGGDVAVATQIYNKRNAGCGLYGSKTYTITQVDGSPFVVRWDAVSPQALYMKFTLKSINGTTLPNVAAIKAGLVSGNYALIPSAGASVNVTEVAALIQSIDPNCYVVPTAGDGVSSDNISFVNLLAPTARNYQFTVSSANITLAASL